MSNKALLKEQKDDKTYAYNKSSPGTINNQELMSTGANFDTTSEFVNYKGKFIDLSSTMQDLYEDFKSFVKNEVRLLIGNSNVKDMGDSLRKLLIEEQENDPFILVKFMKHTMRAIMRFRDEPAAKALKSSDDDDSDSRIEYMLQKAESDIRQHIRVF